MQLILIMSFIYGIIIGSFLNVVIYRVPMGKSLSGRSHCPSCNHKLGTLELVPIFSYLFLGRKCKNCHQPISARYMTVELLTGILYTIFAYILIDFGYYQIFTKGFTINLIIGFVIISSLVSLAFIDYDIMEIPNRFHVILIISGIILTLNNNGSLINSLLSGIAVALPLLLIAFFTIGLGMGDVKLMFASGILFGYNNANIGLLIGCIVAIAYSLILKIGKGKEFPFGPHLAIGMYGSLLITLGQL